MPWPRSAARLKLSWLILVFFCFGAGDISIMLDDGSQLPIPTLFLNRLEFRDSLMSRTQIIGYTKKESSFYVFISRNAGTRDNELKSVLGLGDLVLEPIGDNQSPTSPENKIWRIVNPGSYEGFLMTHQTFPGSNDLGTFFLVGPEPEFYGTAPAFWRMVQDYKPAPTQIGDPVEIKSWMVYTAFILLAINGSIIWFGMKRIARISRQD